MSRIWGCCQPGVCRDHDGVIAEPQPARRHVDDAAARVRELERGMRRVQNLVLIALQYLGKAGVNGRDIGALQEAFRILAAALGGEDG